jgi:hypothetical protein
VAPERRPGPGRGPQLLHRGTGRATGRPLRRLRPHRGRGLGERRRRPRHLSVCRRLDPALVAGPRLDGLSRRAQVADHRGRGRLEQLPLPGLEVGTGRLRGRDGPGRHGVSLSSRYVEMEQGRTPLVLPHRHELARPPADQPRSSRQDHRRDADPHRAPGRGRTRPGLLSHRHHGQQDVPGLAPDRAAPRAGNLELHHPPQRPGPQRARGGPQSRGIGPRPVPGDAGRPATDRDDAGGAGGAERPAGSSAGRSGKNAATSTAAVDGARRPATTAAPC